MNIAIRSTPLPPWPRYCVRTDRRDLTDESDMTGSFMQRRHVRESEGRLDADALRPRPLRGPGRHDT